MKYIYRTTLFIFFSLSAYAMSEGDSIEEKINNYVWVQKVKTPPFPEMSAEWIPPILKKIDKSDDFGQILTLVRMLGEIERTNKVQKNTHLEIIKIATSVFNNKKFKQDNNPWEVDILRAFLGVSGLEEVANKCLEGKCLLSKEWAMKYLDSLKRE